MSPAQLVRRVRSVSSGITLLRAGGDSEIWCRCDGGRPGYLGLAAKAHVDPLSVSVRYAGTEILAYPGAFCFPGERGRRARHAHAREIEVLDDGDIARWTAEYSGTASDDPSVLYRRSVLLDRASRSIDIIDQIAGGSHDIRLAFHLGSDVRAELDDSCAVLCWPAAPTPGAARLELPPGLRWSLSQDIPPATLLGCGRCAAEVPLVARLEFLYAGQPGKSAVSRLAISWTSSAAPSGEAPEIQAEAR
jgi:hypothetical protein